MSGFTPVNQVRLTNVAYVRLTKKSKKFEIACYRNKVLNWRNKIETDLSEVLQIDNIFTNVSKGTLASARDMMDAFGTTDKMLICTEILNKGEMQVTEKEREALHDILFRDIAQIVAEKSINPETNRPYQASMIQNAMKEIHFSINTTKSAKQQALDVIRKLKAVMPIARADMTIRLVCKAGREYEELHLRLESELKISVATALKGTDDNEVVYFDLTIEPNLFKKIEALVHDITAGSGRVEVLLLKAATVVAKDDEQQLVKGMDSFGITKADKDIKIDSTVTSLAKDTSVTTNTAENSISTIAGIKCTTCGGSFENAAEHRAHFKSKWHTHNLKLKMKNLPIVGSQIEFESLTPQQLKLADTEY